MRATGVTLVAAITLASALPAQEPTKPDLLVAIERQLKAAAETAGPSVGCVVVSRSDRYPKVPGAADQPGKLGGYDIKEFLKLNTAPGDARVAVSLDLSDPKNIPDHGYACGVVIDPSGLILTPYHVVEGATKVYVHLPNRVGSYADIHAADGRHDLAVLKLINPPPQLPAIKFADVRLEARNGQRPNVSTGTLAVLMANVYVTGFPVDKPSAALGSVSNIRPRLGLEAGDGKKKVDSYYYFGPFLEHDARLNAGISGAALLNLDGKLIGLTTTTPVVTGGDRAPSYAFPADDAFQRVVEVLRRGEEVDYGYLGVVLDARQNGIIITSVVAQGPAAQAGIDTGDVITHINGIPVGTYDELLINIGSALADAEVKLTVSRFNRERKVNVILGKLKHEQPSIASVRPDAVFGLRVEYGSILAQKLPIGEARTGNGVGPGVCVRELTPNSPAATAFKKLGDRPERWLITHVNGAAVATPAEFYKAAKGQASVKLTVRDPSELNPRDREVSFP
jgi:serine protease Do